MTAPDYSTITETPGDGISVEAAAMMHARYHLVASEAANRDVLEISCGAGQGLGYLARAARKVIGVDITWPLLARARANYPSSIALVQCDAHGLPFSAGRFDVVAIHEAIYYFADVEAAFREARRVMKPGGRLLVSTINPEWSDFNPSPFAVRYLSASELAAILRRYFSSVELKGAFPAEPVGVKLRMLSAAKRLAVRLRLIPRTMKGKRWLKRVVFGTLIAVPSELSAGPTPTPPVSLTGHESAAAHYKVIYATAVC